jgi:hypothetical protein
MKHRNSRPAGDLWNSWYIGDSWNSRNTSARRGEGSSIFINYLSVPTVSTVPSVPTIRNGLCVPTVPKTDRTLKPPLQRGLVREPRPWRRDSWDPAQNEALPADPRHPGKHIDPKTDAWPASEWGYEPRRGFVRDERFARGADRIIKPTSRKWRRKGKEQA